MAKWIDLIDDNLLYLSDPSPSLYETCFLLRITVAGMIRQKKGRQISRINAPSCVYERPLNVDCPVSCLESSSVANRLSGLPYNNGLEVRRPTSCSFPISGQQSHLPLPLPPCLLKRYRV